MLATGDFALPTFEQLCDTGGGHTIVALITQPDRPQGRKQELIPSAIKNSAQARGIAVLQPEDVNAAEAIAGIRALAPDLLVTAAYGQILSAELLTIPRLGGINLHGSVLPAYRGAAPVARAIQRGETETGVTVILMTPRIDAGGMLAVAKTPIEPNETAGELEDRLSRLGAPLVSQCIAALQAGTAQVLPQNKSRVTRAPKLQKDDGRIDWSKPAGTIHNLVRAMQPWPAAYSLLPGSHGERAEPLRVIIHRTEPVDAAPPPGARPGTVLEAQGDRLIVAAGQGGVRLLTVQIAGRKAMPADAFVRGHAALLLGRAFLAGEVEGE
jgi:methionyl-tRNA formyltransferase